MLLFCCFVIYACPLSKEREQEKREYWTMQMLPTGAYKIQKIDDNYLYFSLDGRRYLFRDNDYVGIATFTYIGDE